MAGQIANLFGPRLGQGFFSGRWHWNDGFSCSRQWLWYTVYIKSAWKLVWLQRKARRNNEQGL